MEIKWLEDFVVLAKTGSFSRAADERFVTQSALSKRIKSLEDWLGATLFDRSCFPVALTAQGREFLAPAQEMLQAALRTREQFRAAAMRQGDALRIVALHGLSLNLLPERLAGFMREHPRWPVELLATVQGIGAHFDTLIDGQAHVLVTYEHESLGPVLVSLNEIERATVITDELVPVAAPRLAEAFGLGDLRRAERPVPLLTYTHAYFTERLVRALVDELGNRLTVVYRSPLSENLKAMALQGLGVAWLPWRSIRSELASGDLVRVGQDDLSVRVDITAFRRRGASHPALAALWHHLTRPSSDADASRPFESGTPT